MPQKITCNGNLTWSFFLKEVESCDRISTSNYRCVQGTLTLKEWHTKSGGLSIEDPSIRSLCIATEGSLQEKDVVNAHVLQRVFVVLCVEVKSLQ